jgi:hypothetical protein
MARRRKARGPASSTQAQLVLGTEEASLLDIVDNVLSKGVVLSGDLTIALAQVDLIYARISLLLCAADRVLPHESADVLERHRQRRERRAIRTTHGAAGSRRTQPALRRSR